MDQKKIGSFIQLKRKEKQLTQVQLGEQLGVSGKSVSKWERGVCLPDVSLYKKLCEILGISLNEFFAGEMLPEEKIIPQSEENIIGITKDGNKKRKKLKIIIILVTFIALLFMGMSFYYISEKQPFKTNYLRPYNMTDEEKEFSYLVGSGTTQLFAFKAEQKFNTINFYCTSYKKGKKINKRKICSTEFPSEDYSGEGFLSITYEQGNEKFRVKAVSGEDGGNGSFDNPAEIGDGLGWLRTMYPVSGEEKIGANTEIPLVCWYFVDFNKSDEFAPMGPEDVLSGDADISKADYTILFTCEFE